jgi:hypothetical protein
MKKNVAPQQNQDPDRNAPGRDRDGNFQQRPDEGPDGGPASDQDIDAAEEDFDDDDEGELEDEDKETE